MKSTTKSNEYFLSKRTRFGAQSLQVRGGIRSVVAAMCKDKKGTLNRKGLDPSTTTVNQNQQEFNATTLNRPHGVEIR